MQTAIGIVCIFAVAGAVAYGAILVGAWLRDFARDLRGAVEDDPARDCARDAREED